MKIVFTGGGTGGHFYPLVAIAESVRSIAQERHLIAPKLYYLAPSTFDAEALFENEISFVTVPAGRVRRYFSFKNFTDIFVTASGFLMAYFSLLRIYPDVIVSKGGFASVPVVLAGALLGIPIIIHESDAQPGRANLFAARFAYRIAVSFESTASFFPAKVRSKIALTGIPIRHAIAHPETEGAKELLGLDMSVPTILILGGSSGSIRINETILASLPELVAFANVIHQTGKENFDMVQKTSPLILEKNSAAEQHRYHPFAYLNVLSIRRASGAADLVISRAGMTAITEISLWKKPSILIPIPESISHDQRTNAYTYAKTGATLVIEETNLTPHVLVAEAKRLLSDKTSLSFMSEHASDFGNQNAANIIAEELISIGLSHEPDAAT